MGFTDSSRKIALSAIPMTASIAITIAVRVAPMRPSTTKKSVNAAAVATPFANIDASAGPDGASSTPCTRPAKVTPIAAPIAVQVAAVSESVRTRTRSLTST